MIAQYESGERPREFDSPRQYGLGLAHKHLPEMQAITGIASAPIFNPIVADFYSGMAVSVPIYTRLLEKKVTLEGMFEALSEFYRDSELIGVKKAPDGGFLAANVLEKTCRLDLYVMGNDETMTLTAVFDNLGKGASGAAVQNMNIALGLPETAYLSEGDKLL